MKKYRLAVCKGPECRSGGADHLFSACRELLLQAGLATRCEAYRGGCYGLCHLGPNVVVREDRGGPRNLLAPENFQLMGWEGEYHYSAVNPEKLARILDEHIGADRPALDLVCDAEEARPLVKVAK